MILQSLVAYYERQRISNPAAVAAPGWEYREIAFFLDLGADGSALLIDRRSSDWKRGTPLLVPTAEIRSGKNAWKQPNLLWDHMGFVLGQQKRQPDGTLDETDKPDKVRLQHQAFRRRIERLAAVHPESRGLPAIARFYSRYEAQGMTAMLPATLHDTVLRGVGFNLTFRVQGEVDPVCHEEWVARVSSPRAAIDDVGVPTIPGQCLLTGARSSIARLHPKVSGVTQKPVPLVSANTNEAPAYSSYGKSQALNAPVSLAGAAKYVGALNRLLGRGSRNRIQIGDATTVIWADRATELDAELAAIFGDDDPDAHVDAVRQRLNGAAAGQRAADDSKLHFFVLGLAPNASRIAVRFWLHEPFERLGPRVLQHFDDLRIARDPVHDPATPSMFRLLTAIAPQGKADNIPPRLAGEWMRAILEGTPYPAALLNAAVNRCRAEQSRKHSTSGKPLPNVSYERAALLKACINREHRRRHGLPASHAFIQEELDVNQMDPAYRLGRLFALLERIQSRAQPGINATIRDRYYGAASSTPGAVFPTLLRLKNAHLKKLSVGEATHFERLLGEVCGSVEQPALSEFARQLDLHAQGLFALGYYQQRQSFFTAKANAPATPESPVETQET